jgi:soluble lytic murein transglycosylase
MDLSRSRSRRLLLDCIIAALLGGVLIVPALAKTDAKVAKDTPKTAAAKSAAKPSPAKPAKLSKAPHRPPAKGDAKFVPIPRPRPGSPMTSAPQHAGKPILGSNAILPTSTFLPLTSAAPAGLAGSGYLAPPPQKPAVAAILPSAPPLQRASVIPAAPLAAAESRSTSEADTSLTKQAIDLVRRGRTSDAAAIQKTIGDPLARKLIEWTILRSDENDAGFDRLAGFSAENPSWPGSVTLRKRTEGALWDERRGADTVRSFFASSKPTTAKGKFALARALKSQGDEAAAAQLVRQAWREDACGAQVERMVMDLFGDVLTRADHKARMDRRFYDDDPDAGMRMAQLLGGADLLIGKARKAVSDKASNAAALLEAVPASARGDAGYIFHKAQHLRREDKAIEAARLLQSVPRSASQQHNLDEWWIERRLVARKLLDLEEYQAAYAVARDALPPTKESLRAEHEFTAGWIALRFANNAKAAYQHFSRVGEGTTSPTTLARGEYWQGRAAEAMGHTGEARLHYQQAAQYPTAYYGQIARARIGLGELALRRPPDAGHRSQLANLEVVRAVQLLYGIDARDLVIPFVSDLADKAVDAGALVLVAEIARKNNDARAMLLIGKAALNRGMAFDVYAFPTNGIPEFRMVGPAIDKSVVFAIARQESAFNPRAVSSAKALGLMQVLPGTGKQIAKKFGFAFDQNRMLSDASYNAQMGAAELGDVLESYRGSYILSFVAYNAGRGRVKQWIERYGDPRDPNVDPIDWVERIPFSETRNYVQRVIENMQVYRAQLGGGTRLMIEADLRRGAAAN